MLLLYDLLRWLLLLLLLLLRHRVTGPGRVRIGVAILRAGVAVSMIGEGTCRQAGQSSEAKLAEAAGVKVGLWRGES